MITNKLSLLGLHLGLIFFYVGGSSAWSAQTISNRYLSKTCIQINPFIALILESEPMELYLFFRQASVDLDEPLTLFDCPENLTKAVNNNSPVIKSYIGYQRLHNHSLSTMRPALYWGNIILRIHKNKTVTGWAFNGVSTYDRRYKAFKEASDAFWGAISNQTINTRAVDYSGQFAKHEKEGFIKMSGQLSSSGNVSVIKATWNAYASSVDPQNQEGIIYIKLKSNPLEKYIDTYITKAISFLKDTNYERELQLCLNETIIRDFDIEYHEKLTSDTLNKSASVPLQFGTDSESKRPTLRVTNLVAQTQKSVTKRTGKYPAPAALTPDIIDDFRSIDIAHEILGHGIINRDFSKCLGDAKKDLYNWKCRSEGLAVCMEYSILRAIYNKRKWPIPWKDVKEYTADAYDMDPGMEGNKNQLVYTTGVDLIVDTLQFADQDGNINWKKLILEQSK